jgi:hypothetical protein
VAWEHPTNAGRGVDPKRNASINHAAREMLPAWSDLESLCAFTSGVKLQFGAVSFLPYTATTTRAIPHMAYIYIYTGCNRRNGPNFGRVFLMLNYTEKIQNTCIQS